MGLRLLLSDPWIAGLSCDECQRWLVDLKKREYAKRGGKRVPRPPGSATPCWQCPKCGDEKTPAAGRQSELTARNWRMVQEYFEDRKPGDGVTRRLFGVIRWIIAEHKRGQQQMLVDLTAAKVTHGS